MGNLVTYDKMTDILKNGIVLSNGIPCRLYDPTIISKYISNINTINDLSEHLNFDNSIKFADEQYLMRLICNQFADNLVLSYKKGNKALYDKTNNSIRLEIGRLKEIKKEIIKSIVDNDYLRPYTYDEALELLNMYFTQKEIDKMCLIPISSSRKIYNKKGNKNTLK